MKGISVLITVIFLFMTNTLSAQSNTNFGNSAGIVEVINPTTKVEVESVTPSKRGEQSGITVYPNPAKDDVHIRFEIKQATTIRMSSILGSVLYETTTSPNTRLYSTTLNISNLPKGLYFITIDDGVDAQTKRFVKQ